MSFFTAPMASLKYRNNNLKKLTWLPVTRCRILELLLIIVTVKNQYYTVDHSITIILRQIQKLNASEAQKASRKTEKQRSRKD